MPDHLPTLPSPTRNDYSHGPVSGAATEPEQPLVVLGDGGTGMDDVMELVFIGASIADRGGNIAQITINFNIDVSSSVGAVNKATYLHFEQIYSIAPASGGGARILVLPPPPGDGQSHFLICDQFGVIRWTNAAGSGTRLQGYINGIANFIDTTMC